MLKFTGIAVCLSVSYWVGSYNYFLNSSLFPQLLSYLVPFQMKQNPFCPQCWCPMTLGTSVSLFYNIRCRLKISVVLWQQHMYSVVIEKSEHLSALYLRSNPVSSVRELWVNRLLLNPEVIIKHVYEVSSQSFCIYVHERRYSDVFSHCFGSIFTVVKAGLCMWIIVILHPCSKVSPWIECHVGQRT